MTGLRENPAMTLPEMKQREHFGTSHAAILPCHKRMKTSPGSASRSLVLFIGGLLSLVLAATTQGAPVITGFAPVIAPVGSNVTINGVGFSPTPANNIVRFGAVRATVATASATTLRATVPPGQPTVRSP